MMTDYSGPVKVLAISAWMGMTVRNLFYGPTLKILSESFKINIISYYGEQLSEILPEGSHPIQHSRIAHPRWHCPGLRGAFSSYLNVMEYHAFWTLHRPATAEARMMDLEFKLVSKTRVQPRWYGAPCKIDHER